jgi:hypothetical protein
MDCCLRPKWPDVSFLAFTAVAKSIEVEYEIPLAERSAQLLRIFLPRMRQGVKTRQQSRSSHVTSTCTSKLHIHHNKIEYWQRSASLLKNIAVKSLAAANLR